MKKNNFERKNMKESTYTPTIHSIASSG